MFTKPLLVRGLVCFGAMAALASCDSANRAPSPAPSTTPARTNSPPPRTAPPGKTAILVAYRSMWNAYVQAGTTSDYESPELAKYAAGQAHSTLVRGLYNYRKRGIVIRGNPVFRPRVTELSPASVPTEAAIVDCADESRWRTYDKTGRLAGPAPQGRSRVNARLRLFEDVWKVTELVVQKEKTC